MSPVIRVAVLKDVPAFAVLAELPLVHQAQPPTTLERLEDHLIDAEIHRRDCDHDFEVARKAWLKAVLAESLASDALARARRGAPRG